MTVDPTSPMVNPMTMRWLDTAPAWFREAFTVLWSQLSDIGSQLADITYKEQQVMAQLQALEPPAPTPAPTPTPEPTPAPTPTPDTPAGP
jgi:hypothetical protein